MRVSKFLSISALVTLFALLYVWQQTEIFRLAYEGQKRILLCQDLLDENTLLRYNRAKGVSLTQITSKISKSADFQMPDAYRLVRLSRPSEKIRLAARTSVKQNLIARLFSIQRQAEAKTIER